MSTKDQILSAELHGEALLAAKRPELQPLIDHIREVAQGRDDIRVECAGVIAGSWFSSPARRGEGLVAAALLMLAGHVDLDELDKWVRVGWERRRRALASNTRTTASSYSEPRPAGGLRARGLLRAPDARRLGNTGRVAGWRGVGLFHFGLSRLHGHHSWRGGRAEGLPDLWLPLRLRVPPCLRVAAEASQRPPDSDLGAGSF
jgi:hypothetical protein